MPTPGPTIVVNTPAGTPVWVSGLFVVCAAIFGAGIAFLSTCLSDRRRTKAESEASTARVERETRERWDDSVRDRCIDLLTQTRDISLGFDEAWHLVPHFRSKPPMLPQHFVFGIVHTPTIVRCVLVTARARRRLHEARRQVSAITVLRPSMTDKASDLFAACQHWPLAGEEEHAASTADYTAQRDQFIRDVRQELNVLLPTDKVEEGG